MAIAYNPRIVTDGLLYCMDAGNSKVYDSYENLLTNSEDFSQWSGFRRDVTINQVTGPNSNLITADLITANETNQSGSAVIKGFSYVVGQTYTFSVYVRKSSSTSALLLRPQNSDVFTQAVEAFFNISTGVKGNVTSDGTVFTNATSNISDVGNGWYRCSVTFTVSSAVSTGNARIYVVDAVNSIQVTTGASFYAWGAQMEIASSVGPYYATTTSTKPRGSVLTDLSGVGNTGTLQNAVGYDPANGGSLLFDGINDYISVVDNFGDPQTFTIEIWCKPTELNIDANNNYRRLFMCTGVVPGNECIIIEETGQISFRVPGTNDTTNFVANGFNTYTPSTGKWGHIMCTYDQSLRRTYFNGAFQSQYTQPSDKKTVSFGVPQIVDGSSQVFKGNLAVVRVYNRALSADEIQQNFNALRGRFGI